MRGFVTESSDIELSLLVEVSLYSLNGFEIVYLEHKNNIYHIFMVGQI